MQKEPYGERSGECPEEKLSQSDSPFGVVANDENLGRLIYRNDWIDNDGKLTPAAIQINDLISPERRGVSVCRLDKINNGEIRFQIDKIRSKPDNSFSGIARAKTKEIRNLRTEQGFRSFCVIDDATPEFPAHALLRLDKGEEFTKSAVRRIRKPLLQIFELHRSHIQKDSQN